MVIAFFVLGSFLQILLYFAKLSYISFYESLAQCKRPLICKPVASIALLQEMKANSWQWPSWCLFHAFYKNFTNIFVEQLIENCTLTPSNLSSKSIRHGRLPGFLRWTECICSFFNETFQGTDLFDKEDKHKFVAVVNGTLTQAKSKFSH